MRTRDELRNQLEVHLDTCTHPDQLVRTRDELRNQLEVHLDTCTHSDQLMRRRDELRNQLEVHLDTCTHSHRLMRTRDELRNQLEVHLDTCTHPEQLREILTHKTDDAMHLDTCTHPDQLRKIITHRSDVMHLDTVRTDVMPSHVTGELSTSRHTAREIQVDQELVDSGSYYARLTNTGYTESFQSSSSCYSSSRSDNRTFEELLLIRDLGGCDTFPGMRLTELLEDGDVNECNEDMIESMCQNDDVNIPSQYEDISSLLGLRDISESAQDKNTGNDSNHFDLADITSQNNEMVFN